MEALVIQSVKGQDVTTSLIVAEVFGKRHDHVLRDIENLSCSDGFRLLNFGETPYTHPQNGQTYKAYEITKDGFSFLVMGYTGGKAAEFKEKFIYEFNKREALLKNDDFILSRALSILNERTKSLEAQVSFQSQQLQLADQTIKEQAPMVKAFRDVISADNAHLATAMGQMFDLTASKFNALLNDWKVQRKVGGDWVLCAKYHGKGYAIIHPVPYRDGKEGVMKTKNELRWTEKGRMFLIEFFSGKGYSTVKAAA
jgi:Rha family phage regulatory protein